VAVIGAGSSGLVSLRCLSQEDLDVSCFEQGYDLGGLWVFNNSNGRGGAYRSLHINTSRRQMQFSDFAMPETIGEFPHHTHIAQYLSDYASHFGLQKYIHFGHLVERCIPLSQGGYRLEFAGGRPPQCFDAVVVCNGHHFSPLWPDTSTTAEFSGLISHSYHYKSTTEPIDLRGLRVLVVGMGNSAMDIACELSRQGAAGSVMVSARRGAWVLPKFLRGRPIDGPATFPQWLPGRWRRQLVTRSFEFIYGKMTDFDLPAPDHLIGEAHPTISTEFPALVKSGDIVMKPGFTLARGGQAFFSDGSAVDADAIIFCTGYRVEFPFFDHDHLNAKDNAFPLFFRTFHAQNRHVFFVGLLQTIGAVMPVAEAQARAIALHLSGKYNLPSEAEMQSNINQHEQQMARRFVPSLRHTMQVVPEQFHPSLRRELERGAKRARTGRGIAFPGDQP